MVKVDRFQEGEATQLPFGRLTPITYLPFLLSESTTALITSTLCNQPYYTSAVYQKSIPCYLIDACLQLFLKKRNHYLVQADIVIWHRINLRK
jgi:hypothetical protein